MDFLLPTAPSLVFAHETYTPYGTDLDSLSLTRCMPHVTGCCVFATVPGGSDAQILLRLVCLVNVFNRCYVHTIAKSK